MNSTVRSGFKVFFFNKVLVGPMNSARDLLKKQKKRFSLLAQDPQCTFFQKKKKRPKGQNANAAFIIGIQTGTKLYHLECLEIIMFSMRCPII